MVAHGFRAGDPAATEAVRRRVRKILSYRGYGMPREEQQDLEQEVMTQVWQASNRSGSDLGPGFWGFVEVVTARRSIDWLRTRRRHDELDPELADRGTTPLEQAISKEREQLVASTLERLPEPCRKLIFLHARLNKSYREISSIMNKSEGALRIQMHRCVRRAREIIEELKGSGTSADVGASGDR